MKKYALILLVWCLALPGYAQQTIASAETAESVAAKGGAGSLSQSEQNSVQNRAAQPAVNIPLVQMDIVVEPGPGAEQQQGQLLIALDVNHAPITTRNFLNYVEDHFYDGIIFHRLIADFMIQGGGFSPGMKSKTGKAPIINEATADLKNEHGTIAMARTMEVDSASSQFFINFKDNAFLDHQDSSAQGYGYAVFGRVVSGLDWLDSLQKMSTHHAGDYSDVPVRQIVIKRVRLLSGEARQQAVIEHHVDQAGA